MIPFNEVNPKDIEFFNRKKETKNKNVYIDEKTKQDLERMKVINSRIN